MRIFKGKHPKGPRRFSMAPLFRRLDDSGAVAIEFAILGPVMVALLVAGFTMGQVSYNYTLIATAATTGARTISQGRGTTTPYDDLKNSVVAAATSSGTIAAANVNGTTAGSITVTIGPPGGTATACTTNAGCITLLASAATTSTNATVTVSTPCMGSSSSLKLAGYPVFTGCNLTSAITQRVE